mmetsp:Transcript_22513/g.73160  ORF Transcript_22513/g.73160 Transcript_22513/m.73160 type:complete len:107 (+) Transcript_22513:85-405(+)
MRHLMTSATLLPLLRTLSIGVSNIHAVMLEQLDPSLKIMHFPHVLGEFQQAMDRGVFRVASCSRPSVPFMLMLLPLTLRLLALWCTILRCSEVMRQDEVLFLTPRA